MGASPAGVAQQCPRCDYSSSEVCQHNFVTFWGGEAVYGMRKVRCPYSQSCNLGMSHSQMLGKVESGGGPIFKVALEC